MSEPTVVQVHQLNGYMSRLINAQSVLSNLRVRGEVSNFKQYRSGHLYFSLKDEKAVVSCVMFQSSARTLQFAPKDGDEVICSCRAGFYEKDGKFQLYVNRMNLTGQGNLFEAYEQLRNRLAAEGLFDERHKRPLPLLPRKIGVVTSPSGAVIRDIIHVLSRRFPNVALCLYPCQVQGEGAAASVAEGIRVFNRRADCDVLIIGRGGGSIEDLWAFNDEQLARTIFASRIPIVSAVGHETDFTIADFVADLRAPTPSAAAERVMPLKSALQEQLDQMNNRSVRALRHRLDVLKLRTERLITARVLVHPSDRLDLHRQELDLLQERLIRSLTDQVAVAKNKLSGLSISLDALSPLKVLARGYGLVTDQQSRPLTSVQGIACGDRLDVRLADGVIRCSADAVLPDHAATVG